MLSPLQIRLTQSLTVFQVTLPFRCQNHYCSQLSLKHFLFMLAEVQAKACCASSGWVSGTCVPTPTAPRCSHHQTAVVNQPTELNFTKSSLSPHTSYSMHYQLVDPIEYRMSRSSITSVSCRFSHLPSSLSS